MNEQEEFEFRHRLEQEQAAPPDSTPEPSLLSKAGTLAKQFFLTGHPNAPGHEPIEPSIGDTMAYPGGVLSTAAIQGAKALAGKGSMDDMQAALHGHAKSAPEQLEESGWPATAAYGVGVPLQVATDPFASVIAPPAVKPIGQGLSEVGNYISNKLGRGAEYLATSHLRPTAAMTRKMGDAGVRSAAREALDSGAIGFGAKADTTAANLGNLVDEVGAVKGDIVNGSSAQINPNDIAAQIQNRVVSPLRATSETQPLADTISGKADAFLKQYPGETMSPAQLEAEKMAAQSNVNYGANSQAANDAAGGYARVLKEGVENAVTDPNFKAAKTSFGNLKNAQTMADRTASVSSGGLTDTGLNVAAIAHPNPVTLGAAGGRALLKGRMASAGAVALDKSSKAVQALTSSNMFTPSQISRIASSPFSQVLERAGDSGGSSAVATTHYVLQQTDPGYQQLLKDEQN